MEVLLQPRDVQTGGRSEETGHPSLRTTGARPWRTDRASGAGLHHCRPARSVQQRGDRTGPFVAVVYKRD